MQLAAHTRYAASQGYYTSCRTGRAASLRTRTRQMKTMKVGCTCAEGRGKARGNGESNRGQHDLQQHNSQQDSERRGQRQQGARKARQGSAGCAHEAPAAGAAPPPIAGNAGTGPGPACTTTPPFASRHVLQRLLQRLLQRGRLRQLDERVNDGLAEGAVVEEKAGHVAARHPPADGGGGGGALSAGQQGEEHAGEGCAGRCSGIGRAGEQPGATCGCATGARSWGKSGQHRTPPRSLTALRCPSGAAAAPARSEGRRTRPAAPPQ